MGANNKEKKQQEKKLKVYSYDETVEKVKFPNPVGNYTEVTVRHMKKPVDRRPINRKG